MSFLSGSESHCHPFQLIIQFNLILEAAVIKLAFFYNEFVMSAHNVSEWEYLLYHSFTVIQSSVV